MPEEASMDEAIVVLKDSERKRRIKGHIGGNAAVPLAFVDALIKSNLFPAQDDPSKRPMFTCIHPLDKRVADFYSEQNCKRFEHRLFFNSAFTRAAVNEGRAHYQRATIFGTNADLVALGTNTVIMSVQGPDQNGNYSYGAKCGALPTALGLADLVIAERNKQMPFVHGTLVPGRFINILVDTDYPLPTYPLPTEEADEKSRKTGRIIAFGLMEDNCGLQLGISAISRVVADGIIERGLRNLYIFSELFENAMKRLVELGIVTKSEATFVFFASQKDYDWLGENSEKLKIYLRPCSHTNDPRIIAQQPKLRAINSAMEVDLEANVRADTRGGPTDVYQGVGGQPDFVRGVNYSRDGLVIIALPSVSEKGIPKIVPSLKLGCTHTADSYDRVVVVTENGYVRPHGLSQTELAFAMAHLAAGEHREELLKHVRDTYKMKNIQLKGFTSYEQIFGSS